MFAKMINSLATHTQQTKQMLDEITEFRALKAEINKARCVIEFDSKGNITSVNDNVLQSLGYSQSELVNQHHRTLLGRAEATSSEYQSFWQSLSAGKTQTGMFPLQTKVGSVVWFQGYYAPVMQGENLRKVVAYLTDVSVEKAKGLRLQASEAGVNSLFGVIELSLDTEILDINEVSLKALGYTKQELVGRKLDILLKEEDRNSTENKEQWEQLKKGVTQIRQVRRITKDGRELWFQASYYPILGIDGKPEKVVAYTTCVTSEKNKNADYQGQLNAISKIQGVIEFDLQGKVLAVNDNFAKATGYTKEEMLGKHHSMFVDSSYQASSEYKAMWDKLASGKADAGVYKRIAKGGREIWLQATYNPILDLTGKPFKVVAYTTDVTKYKMMDAENEGQLAAINKIQGVVEFDLTGKITRVNTNFIDVIGYSESELLNSNHSTLVDSAYRSSQEYKALWDKLARGEADIGQYKYIAKGGKERWLQASYNPILDMNGKPFKVVAFSTDITAQHQSAAELETAVEETQAVIEFAQQGNLTQRVPMDGKTGAIASLCGGVNALMDKMAEVIEQVRDASETINTAAGEIATGNTDLSQRTEQQATNLEKTSTSMEELSSTVKQNAENAKQANQLAAAASGVALRGGEVVGNVVTTMSAINDSAHKIEDIISVIDGIAFQTNILALNAAVEAARAGEQGRGFAVVAGEVRNLAQRSASAAKEIKELITDSVNKTSEGTKQVEAAGDTMREIVSSVQRVTDIMGEITAASQEQSSGIDQVNQAVSSMDEVTQQNAALVEQAAAAAESLVEQASTLMETVSNFKLSGSSNSNNRRASSSPMRSAQASKPRAARPAPAASPKVMAKTGTDDSGDWAEF